MSLEVWIQTKSYWEKKKKKGQIQTIKSYKAPKVIINPSTLMKTGHLAHSNTGAQMPGHAKRVAGREKNGNCVFMLSSHPSCSIFSLIWDDDKQDKKVDNLLFSKYLWNACFCYLSCLSYLFLKTTVIKWHYFHFTHED